MTELSERGAPPFAVRARSLDLLRGGVMVLMVLDQARDFFVGIGSGPTDLATTTVPLFLTRWVTHSCAPVFVLLAGVSAQLYAAKHGLPRARRFLLTRGLGLVLLELTFVRFAWIPDRFYHFVLLQVQPGVYPVNGLRGPNGRAHPAVSRVSLVRAQESRVALSVGQLPVTCRPQARVLHNTQPSRGVVGDGRMSW